MSLAITIIVPAHNEAALLANCLAALLGSHGLGQVQVIVAANGCTDATVAIAQGFARQAQALGWDLLVLDLADGGKPGALNAADAVALHPSRAYLDADVTVDARLLAQIIAVLDQPAPAYASGSLVITGTGRVARAYAAVWAQVPFMAQGVPGCGFFAVNAAGRARWGQFPPIISDDTFVRLQFSPQERHLVAARYYWPVAEGFANLVRVRRRQDAGVKQVARLYPALMSNDATPALSARRLAQVLLSGPLAFAVYAAVALAVRLKPAGSEWSRGR